ncbi:Uncharacterised protein [Mycobacteroides abscessus subsp. abscessus]|nr:Uncharacterised protein [Mycobacteroides abscessus subsp. abscessus]
MTPSNREPLSKVVLVTARNGPMVHDSEATA